ncbi:MAG TPA: hypothetical protein PKD26_07780 [Pyrinomonadaceae bacterium]|nr:hypothetical protein [Pyrinomonadaceae bacterium]
MNVRTNHVHVVVAIGEKRPKDVLIALKANATRQLREDGLWTHEHTPWADKGINAISGTRKASGKHATMLLMSKVTSYPTSTGGEKNPVASAPGSDPTTSTAPSPTEPN